MAIREAHLEKACSVCGGPLFICDGNHSVTERQAAEKKRIGGLSSEELFGDLKHEPGPAEREWNLQELRQSAVRVRAQIMEHVKSLGIGASPLAKTLDRYLNLVDKSMYRRVGKHEAEINKILEGQPNEKQLEMVLKVLIAARVSEEQMKRPEAQIEEKRRAAA